MCCLVFVQLLTFCLIYLCDYCDAWIFAPSFTISLILLYCVGEGLRAEVQWFSGVMNA